MLRKVSARYCIDGLLAPLYLIRDRADRFIPWIEGERLAAACRPKERNPGWTPLARCCAMAGACTG
jgi:hypothetical protein